MNARAIIDALDRAESANSLAMREKHLKRCLASVWAELSVESRFSFVHRLNHDDKLQIIPFKRRWPKLHDPMLEEAARTWWLVVRDIEGGSSEDVKFAHSIQSQMNNPQRPNWKPTPKQRDYMVSLYREWTRWKDTDGTVLEDAE